LSDVSCTPTWFGPVDQPMLGWIHQPAGGRIRGAVVICPPFGIELGATYATLRVLADRLAAATDLLAAVRVAEWAERDPQMTDLVVDTAPGVNAIATAKKRAPREALVRPTILGISPATD